MEFKSVEQNSCLGEGHSARLMDVCMPKKVAINAHSKNVIMKSVLSYTLQLQHYRTGEKENKTVKMTLKSYMDP